jgi:hypothetical protein
MRIIIEYTPQDSQGGGRHTYQLDVEYNQRIDDVIALLTVQNPHIDFDRIDL